MNATATTPRRIAKPDEWQAARDRLLAREKEHTRLGDEIARRRRELPWLPVEKAYRFDTDEGEKTLIELFDGRSQLLVYHFMFGPTYTAGCPTNSSIADAVDGLIPHLEARDVTFVFVSRAPLEKLNRYKRRMGWSFPWISSGRSDFNVDLGVSHTVDEMRESLAPVMASLPPIALRNASATGTDVATYLAEGWGFNAFALEGGTVYRTYSAADRGVEFLMTYYGVLDRAPNGRDEGDDFQLWIRRHDEYERP
jgi:predicted dithiol-disulfide oxidoreductase (DUF899 family)